MARTLKRAHAVHASDADGGQQPADRRRDEAHEEGDEGDRINSRAREQAERSQGDRSHQKDDGQAREQDGRAISFGVRWRLAPSTRAIIRSRNVSPGSAVMRITR